MKRLAEIENLPIDDLMKGVPGGTTPFRLGDIGSKGWNLLREDLPLPVAVIKQSALANNSRWMARFLERVGAVIAPHGKTTMSPQLFERQLDDGAWAITVATPQQLQVCRHFGFERIVLANQLVGRQAVRTLLDALHADPKFEFYCLVDSVDGVCLLAEAAAAHPLERPVNVLLEAGTAGGRTGCRDQASALAVARAVQAAAPHLALRGVEGFEGLIIGDSDADQDAKVRAFVDFLVSVAVACERQGLFAPGPVILSAGGSAFYDLAADGLRGAVLDREVKVVTRSGCYLTHDSAMYRRFFARLEARTPEVQGLGEGLEPALELWAYVQSRPEPAKAILTLGKRDVSYDAGLPVAELWYRPGAHEQPEPVLEGCVVTALNDQHAHMTVPADSPLRVGDMVSFGIAHPCTTFDKWQLIYLVDEDYDVVSAIRTFF